MSTCGASEPLPPAAAEADDPDRLPRVVGDARPGERIASPVPPARPAAGGPAAPAAHRPRG